MEYKSDVSGIIIEEKLEDFLATKLDGGGKGNGKLWTLKYNERSNIYTRDRKRGMKKERWEKRRQLQKLNFETFSIIVANSVVITLEGVKGGIGGRMKGGGWKGIVTFVIGFDLFDALLRRKTANEDVTARRMKGWMDG
ncbi:hypothetical protein V1478_008950 [Vespula squamosa]|uniref:Uncharacterized protein n=1 Tax=Vespula squamosa TaxID=30214 RepID=A0ABD2AUY6_VESSQ